MKQTRELYVDMILEILITYKQNEKVDDPSRVTRNKNNTGQSVCYSDSRLLKYSSPRKCCCAKYTM